MPKKKKILHPEISKSCMVVQILVLRRQIEICVTIHAWFSQFMKWDLRDSTLGFEPRHTLPGLADLWNCEGRSHNPLNLVSFLSSKPFSSGQQSQVLLIVWNGSLIPFDHRSSNFYMLKLVRSLLVYLSYTILSLYKLESYLDGISHLLCGSSEEPKASI